MRIKEKYSYQVRIKFEGRWRIWDEKKSNIIERI